MKKEEFEKSLGRLQNMAKGSGSTQLYHTPSDSEPGTWPGGRQEDQNEHEDNIGDDGTDYQTVRKSLAQKVRKSQALTPAEVAIAEGRNPRQHIGQKVTKGEQLTPAENWALKANFMGTGDDTQKSKDKPGEADTPGEAGGQSASPPTHAGSKKNEEVEEDAKKSLENSVNSSLELQKGVEASAFLYEFARAVGDALGAAEQNVTKSVTDAINQLAGRVENIEKSLRDGEEFNKALADSVVGIGEYLGASQEAGLNKALQPAGGPKSNFRPEAGPQNAQNGVGYVEKSHGPGGLESDLTKSQIRDAMVDMVSKSQLNHMDVLKFEHTGEILPQTRDRVLAHIRSQGGN